jgi:hypothetical protein
MGAYIHEKTTKTGKAWYYEISETNKTFLASKAKAFTYLFGQTEISPRSDKVVTHPFTPTSFSFFFFFFGPRGDLPTHVS